MAQAKAVEKAPAQEKNNEVTYTAKEFAASAKKLFGTTQDVVTAAFAVAGIGEATVEDAKKIVNTFAKKEVK